MYILSEKTRRGISRRVWAVWILRKTTLPALIVALVALETLFVSVGAVFSGALSSAANPGSFWNFWVSAISNAELHVIVISGFLFIFGAVLVWRLCVAGLTGVFSLIKKSPIGFR